MRSLPFLAAAPAPARRTAVWLSALTLAVTGATTGCLPDQLDGQQESVVSDPVLDLSWFDETSARDVLDAGLVAMAEIGSVRVKQDVENPGNDDPVVSKDLLLATGDGIGGAVDGDCAGTLQLPSWGEPAELLVQDDLGVFRGSADFWSTFGEGLDVLDDDIRALLSEEYADAWTTTPGLATLCTFTDFISPVMVAAGDDDAVKAGLGDVAGVPAGRVVSTSRQRTITTWVRIAEPHLILRVAVRERRRGGERPPSTVTTFSEPDSALEPDFPAAEEIRVFELPTETAVTGG